MQYSTSLCHICEQQRRRARRRVRRRGRRPGRGRVGNDQQGGRATITFEYRIVAKPREEKGARLARVAEDTPPVSYLPGAGRSQKIPLPLSPEELLKRKIGPRAYAKIMTALDKRFAPLHVR